jgi:hypothetical protein
VELLPTAEFWLVAAAVVVTEILEHLVQSVEQVLVVAALLLLELTDSFLELAARQVQIL